MQLGFDTAGAVGQHLSASEPLGSLQRDTISLSAITSSLTGAGTAEDNKPIEPEVREAEGVEDIGKDSEDEVFLSPEPEDRPEGSRKSSRKKKTG